MWLGIRLIAIIGVVTAIKNWVNSSEYKLLIIHLEKKINKYSLMLIHSGWFQFWAKVLLKPSFNCLDFILLIFGLWFFSIAILIVRIVNNCIIILVSICILWILIIFISSYCKLLISCCVFVIIFQILLVCLDSNYLFLPACVRPSISICGI